MTENKVKKPRNRGSSLKASEYNIPKFKNALYTLRANPFRTQEDAAKLVGCSAAQWARHERGSLKQLSIDFIERVCRTFNVDKSMLLEKISAEKLNSTKIIMEWVTNPEAMPYLIEAHKKYMIDKISSNYNDFSNPESVKAFQTISKL